VSLHPRKHPECPWFSILDLVLFRDRRERVVDCLRGLARKMELAFVHKFKSAPRIRYGTKKKGKKAGQGKREL